MPRLTIGASPLQASPRVTAIVLNWCNEPDTAACLESLAGVRYDALGVLLVDNNSPDGSGDRLHSRFPAVQYLQTESNLGYAGGNNRGFAAAMHSGADYLLVLNDDTVVDEECVDLLVRAAEETGAAVTAPQIVYYDDPQRVWYGGGVLSRTRALGVHLRENEPVDPSQVRATVSFVCGCCFLIRASVLREVGGFDETFFAYAEDAELSLRLLKKGHRLVYEPEAKVLHRIKPRAAATPFQIRQRDRNRRRIAALHYGALDRLRFAAWFYATRAAHFIRYAASGNGACARAIVEGAFGSLRTESSDGNR